MSSAIATLDFNAEQRKLIRDTYANGANDSEFGVLMEIAKARGLSPLKRQIWFIKRWDSIKRCEVWAAQTSIDGLRCIAEWTGQYDGQDEPEFSYTKDGQLVGCRVRVWRKGISRPFVTNALYTEFVQTTKDKDSGATRPNAMWTKSPHVMLAKCAEALSLRKAFPEETADLYTPEEIDAGPPEKDVTPQASTVTVDAVKAKLSQALGPRKMHIVEEPPAAPALPADTQLAPPKVEKPTTKVRIDALWAKAKSVTTAEGFKKWVGERLQSDKSSDKLTHDDIDYLEKAYAETLGKPKSEPAEDAPF